MLINALFSFVVFIKKGSRHFYHVTIFPRIGIVKLLQSIVLVWKA